MTIIHPAADRGWARWPWQQCRARREPRGGSDKTQYFGRCELRRGHKSDHALERGFDMPTWSTDWTDTGRPVACPACAHPFHNLSRCRCGWLVCEPSPGCTWHEERAAHICQDPTCAPGDCTVDRNPTWHGVQPPTGGQVEHAAIQSLTAPRRLWRGPGYYWEHNDDVGELNAELYQWRTQISDALGMTAASLLEAVRCIRELRDIRAHYHRQLHDSHAIPAHDETDPHG